MPLIFSICGSFWYPNFVSLLAKPTSPSISLARSNLRNGLTEGSNHKNRLAKAPSFAKEVHECIKKQCLSTYSALDPYGHHDHLQERYDAFSDWLIDAVATSELLIVVSRKEIRKVVKKVPTMESLHYFLLCLIS